MTAFDERSREEQTAVERVRAAYSAIDAADRPEIWISLRPMAEALADAATIDAAVDAASELPLAGLVVAVKNNVDVAGLPTTAGYVSKVAVLSSSGRSIVTTSWPACCRNGVNCSQHHAP